jgi:hypothetical protein
MFSPVFIRKETIELSINKLMNALLKITQLVFPIK